MDFSASDLRVARAELGWWYTRGSSALGRRSSGFEGGDGVSVWDSARNDRAHAARHQAAHRGNVDRYNRIAVVVSRMSAPMRHVASAAWEPRTSDYVLRVACWGGEGECYSLADVALMVPECEAAWRRGKTGPAAARRPTRVELIAWMRAQAESGGRPLQTVLRAARGLLDEAVADYARARVAAIAVGDVEVAA